ncbi:hypothetical protein MTR67_048746 [Solanum verrucosum]|uniref:Uncharacterized protein n=1 Tax=Solanum verrucosum TaxID=315347 RepID=A0AAF0V277_SOLVR|nr:hypothetical protein MTR67_048746 [Solanum verrucosum]
MKPMSSWRIEDDIPPELYPLVQKRQGELAHEELPMFLPPLLEWS